jgi:hypothetical protein
MNRLLKLLLLGAFIVSSVFGNASWSYAGEVDLLLQKLVEKGILSAGEAQQIKTETSEQVKKEIAQGKYSNLPQWVQTMKMKGDFRLRYQYDHTKQMKSNPGTTDRQRARIRLRLGIEGKVNDKVKVGVGLATGSTGDPRSTNQTLDSSFTKKAIILDYAYAQYDPYGWLSLVGGKFKNNLWEPGDLIWDTDITPEGLGVNFNKKLNSKTALFLNTGVFVLDEAGNGDDDDPMMYAVQPGITHQLTDTVSLKGAFSYYNFANVKGRTLDYNSGTNTAVGGLLLNDYAALFPALEISIKEPLKAVSSGLPAFMNFPYFSVFGEYVANPLKEADLAGSTRIRRDSKNTGFMVGFKLGAEKVEKWADWQFRYNYAKLSKDAIPDILPDSDRYGGKTGMKAHEGMIDFGLGKNTWLGIDFYYAEQLKGNFSQKQSKPTTLVQVDWNMKF